MSGSFNEDSMSHPTENFRSKIDIYTDATNRDASRVVSGFNFSEVRNQRAFIQAGQVQTSSPFLPALAPERPGQPTPHNIFERVIQPIRNMLKWIGKDSVSKVNDGLVPPVVLTLLGLLFSLLVQPVQQILLLPGMLVLGLFTLAMGAYSLDRCIQERYSQPERAFQGMLAGSYFWFSADIASRLGEGVSSIQTSAIMMLLVALVLTALWRTVFPIGVKFFGMIFLLNWVDRFLFTGQGALLKIWNFPAQMQTVYGWIAVSITVLLIGWIFLRSTSRIYRLWAAAGVWFFGLQAVALLCGWAL